MPLSFYPGKTDEQLIRGLSFMHPEEFMTGLGPEQQNEFGEWLDSDNVKRITHQNTLKSNWGLGFLLWMKANLLVGFVVIMAFRPVPLNGIAPMHFIGWWLLIAAVIGIIAPIKVRLWWFWVVYGVLITLTLAMTGQF